MAWDTNATKERIIAAAVDEFATHGPDGTTIERIAKQAGINKERIYAYFGPKRTLFDTVLHQELAKVAQAIPIDSFATEDIAAYAGNVYDYHLAHPELGRLLQWEALSYAGEVPNEAVRRAHYARKVHAVILGQESGAITSTIDAESITFLVLAIAGYWSCLPQVVRMIESEDAGDAHDIRRTAVIEAVTRLVSPDLHARSASYDR